MTITRIATSTTQDQVRASMQVAQAKLGTISKQISSGEQSDTFLGIANDVSTEAFLNVKNIWENANAKVKNNSLLQNKLAEQEKTVRGLQEVASKVKLFIQTVKSPESGSQVDVVGLAKNHLHEIKNLLSSQFNGQYLFSGAKVDINPTDDIVNVSNIVLGIPTANYYKGDDVVSSSNISDKQNLEYGIKANDPSIQKLIASLHKAIEGKTLNDPTKYTDAAALGDQSHKELSSMISKVGSNSKAIESAVKEGEKAISKFNDFIKQVQKTDEIDVLTKLPEIQTQLQVAMMLLTRINSMSLADYIK
jgi:flagellar hook-associated protein 3 FlgL